MAADKTPDRTLRNRPARWWLAGLIGVNVIVFGPAITHGWVMWDDPAHVLVNPLVRNWWEAPWSSRLLTPRFGYPIPLPVAVYAVIWNVFGQAAAPAVHAVSILIHLVNLSLVYAVARRWVGRWEIALLGAAIWSLHPVVTESVAWASNLNELVATLGILLGIFGWQGIVEGRGRREWGAMAAGIAIAVSSKPIVLVVGPALLVIVYLSSAEGRRRRRLYLVGGLVTVIIASWVAFLEVGLRANLGSASVNFEARNWGITVLKAAGVYAGNYLYPLDLQPYYPLELRTFDPYAVGGVLVLVVGACAVLAALYRTWLIAFPLSFTALTYLPYSNVRPIPRFASDTYLYLPSVGLAMCLGAGAVFAYERAGDRLGKRAWSAVVCILLFGFSALSVMQVPRWSTTERLFGPLLGTPDVFALPYSLIAYEKFRDGNYQEAAGLLKKAWPRLERTRELPRFAPRAFLKSGDRRMAGRARLRVAEVYGGADAEFAEAFGFIVEHGLPPPRDPEVVRLFRRSFSAWKKQRRMSAAASATDLPSPGAVSDYLQNHGLSRSRGRP